MREKSTGRGTGTGHLRGGGGEKRLSAVDRLLQLRRAGARGTRLLDLEEDDSAPTGKPRRGGSNLLKKHTRASMIMTDDTYGSDSSIIGHNEMLIKEEMSIEMRSRRSSPGLVARLMGLDSLPSPQPARKEWVQLEPRSKRNASAELKKITFSEDQIDRLNKEQRFKDVFEVLETCKYDKFKNPPIEKRLPYRRKTSKETDSLREQFLEARLLSSGRKNHESKQISAALEVLDYNAELFLDLLREPNALFSKHFGSRPRFRSINMESSKIKKHGKEEISWKSGLKFEKHTQLRRDVKIFLHKHENNLINHSFKEHSNSILESKIDGEPQFCPYHTKIVVLKPTSEKSNGGKKTLSSTMISGSFLSHCRGQAETSGQLGIHMLSNGRGIQTSRVNVEMLRKKANYSRNSEKHKEMFKKHDLKTSSYSVLALGVDEFARCRCSVDGLDREAVIDSESSTFTSGKSDCSSCSSSQTLCAADLSFDKTAHKQRHRRYGRYQSSPGVELVRQGLSISRKSVLKKEMAGSSLRETKLIEDYSPDINTVGCNYKCSTNLPRSKFCTYMSHEPNACSTCIDKDEKGILDPISRKSSDGNHMGLSKRKMKSGGNNSLPIHLPKEKQHQDTRTDFRLMLNDISICKRPERFEYSDARFYDALPLVDEIKIWKNQDKETAYSKLDKCKLQPTIATAESPKDGDIIVNNMKSKKIPPVVHKADPLPTFSHYPKDESLQQPRHTFSGLIAGAPTSFSGEKSFCEEDGSSPESFQRVNANIRELRLKLQLLQLESKARHGDRSKVLNDGHTLSDIPQTLFTNEDDRDFSYLDDILTVSGLHGLSPDMVQAATYQPKLPLRPGVFEKLEKKYDAQPKWSKAERKLLFDTISLLVSEQIAPEMDLHPWSKSKRAFRGIHCRRLLPEHLWQLLVRRRREMCRSSSPASIVSNMEWSDVGDDGVAATGVEMEKTLVDLLLGEIVVELICQ